MTPASAPRFGEIARQLAAAGYPPIPLLPESKRPFLRGWPKLRIERGDLDQYLRPRQLFGARQFLNHDTGIVCGEIIGVDIDVRDAKIAARLKALALRALGPALCRIGAAPKCLLVYRTEEPLRKIRSGNVVLPGDDAGAEGYKPHAVEVLATGQQFAAFGVHNTTHKPYHWVGGRSPLTRKASSLACVTEAQCREFVAKAEALMLAAGGVTHSRAASPAPCKHVTSAARAISTLPADLRRSLASDARKALQSVITTPLEARNKAACLRAVASLDNRDLHYDEWIGVGLAIAGALGEAGRAAWFRFSRKSSKHDERGTARAWETFMKYRDEGRLRSGAGTIHHLARLQGKLARVPYWKRPAAALELRA